MSSEASINLNSLTRTRPVRGMPKIRCHRGSLLLGPNLALALSEASERKLGLFLSEGVEVGEEVSLTIEASVHLRPLKFTGKVSACNSLPNNTHRISVELDKRLEWNDLMLFT